MQELKKRLTISGLDPEFDVVHHFGLFYHLRDPLLSFASVREVLPVGGLMLLETAFVDDDENSYMAFSGLPGSFHFGGISDTWAPTKRCLREILLRSLFKPVREECWSVTSPSKSTNKLNAVGRITMIAKSLADNEVNPVDLRKIAGL